MIAFSVVLSAFGVAALVEGWRRGHGVLLAIATALLLTVTHVVLGERRADAELERVAQRAERRVRPLAHTQKRIPVELGARLNGDRAVAVRRRGEEVRVARDVAGVAVDRATARAIAEAPPRFPGPGGSSGTDSIPPAAQTTNMFITSDTSSRDPRELLA
ncbi:MAG TPA: hypothetical protein VH231_12005 [Solirubrobacteraceae bacterium]|jgi:hypothetical protein|nr:hypothetical protein [Solirubrobacteraceae bacterium]